MLTKIATLTDKAKQMILENLDRHFKVVEGEDLDSIVAEVLNDRDLFLFLAVHAAEDDGLKLGNMAYFDDIGVDVHYGLHLDFSTLPRSISIYTFESTEHPIVAEGNKELQKHLHVGFKKLPKEVKGYRLEGYPTPEQFIGQVNRMLQNLDGYVVKLNIPPYLQ